MGRYPVAARNYLHFMEDGGYRQEKFWTAGAFEEYSAPKNWRRQLRHPNRPVVGVSWFEASAYCAWAGGRLPTEAEWGCVSRHWGLCEWRGGWLPTEAEWECAALDGREGIRYPWGDKEPDAYHANFYEAGPHHLTPVGLYPEGATPRGIEDLAGNCWEWVNDWWCDDYEKPAERGERPVMRGGAWFTGAWRLRVSDRNSSGSEGQTPE